MTDNFAKYKVLLKQLSQESNQAVWTSGTWMIVIMFLLLIIATAIIRIFVPFADMLITFFIFLAEVIALLIPVLIYHHKAGEYMRERCLELDTANQGLYEAYEEWKQRFREITTSSS